MIRILWKLLLIKLGVAARRHRACLRRIEALERELWPPLLGEWGIEIDTRPGSVWAVEKANYVQIMRSAHALKVSMEQQALYGVGRGVPAGSCLHDLAVTRGLRPDARRECTLSCEPRWTGVPTGERAGVTTPTIPMTKTPSSAGCAASSWSAKPAANSRPVAAAPSRRPV